MEVDKGYKRKDIEKQRRLPPWYCPYHKTSKAVPVIPGTELGDGRFHWNCTCQKGPPRTRGMDDSTQYQDLRVPKNSKKHYAVDML